MGWGGGGEPLPVWAERPGWRVEGVSEGLVVPQREVSLGGGGAGGALVHALRARALVLLFRARAGRDGGGGRGRGARLLLKVRDDDCHVAHRDGQLLRRAPVDVLQLGSGVGERGRQTFL